MLLIDLPNEVLFMLPDHLRSIEDFMNVSSSCRTLRAVFANTKPNTILRLAAAQSRVFFRPDPYFLVAATASQVGQWGLQSAQNTEVIRDALRNGIEGLFELCISVAGLTMEDIRRLHLARFDLINPVADLIDRMAGKQWYETPDFWNGGVSEPNTIDCEPTRTTFQYIIYGEIFGPSMRAWLQPELSLPQYSLHVRLDYMRYCVPEWITQRGSPGLGLPQPTGPYRGHPKCKSADGLALHHVLSVGRWRRPWAAIRQAVGPDFQEEWRQEVWREAVQLHGLAGLEMLVKSDGVDKWQTKLREIRSQIEQLDGAHRPKSYQFGRQNIAFDCPMPSREIKVIVGGMWEW